MIAISSPLLVGIYDNNKLIKSFLSNEQTTQILPQIFKEILKSFTCKRLFYTKGPGSYMAIKASYIFLRTLQISLKIPFFACDGFTFNKNSPIKSIGNKWFFKKNDKIILKNEKILHVSKFELPKILDIKKFDKDTDPLYVLPAV